MATIINGCDTMIQINTAAKLQTLQNNGYCSIGFLGDICKMLKTGRRKSFLCITAYEGEDSNV